MSFLFLAKVTIQLPQAQIFLRVEGGVINKCTTKQVENNPPSTSHIICKS